MEKRTYVDSARTLEILKQDSGLLPKPSENWNTFEPKEGDYAHVDEGNQDYQFVNGGWVEVETPDGRVTEISDEAPQDEDPA